MSYLFDILIVAVLAFFAWRDAVKGLVLSLCGLAAVFAAYFGAQFVSNQFCGPVANMIRPVIAQSFRDVEPEPTVGEDGEQQGYTLEQLMDSIQENGLFEGFSAFLEEGVANDEVEKGGWQSPLDALASYLSKGMARALLFGTVFVGILLIWFLASHALDLAFKLPILAEVNLAGGLVVGLVKGALLTVVLVWLGQLAGVVPSGPETPVLSLFTVKRLGELLGSLPG